MTCVRPWSFMLSATERVERRDGNVDSGSVMETSWSLWSNVVQSC